MPTLEARDAGLAGDPKMVDRLRGGDPAAIEELHLSLRAGPQGLAARFLGAPAAESWCLELHPALVRAVQRGYICDFGELVAFVHRRLAAVRKEQATAKVAQREAAHTAEPSNADARTVRVMIDVLRRLPPRDREAVARFYVSGHREETICRETSLSITEFRALRSNIRLISRLCGRPRCMGPQRQRGVTLDCPSPATSALPPRP